MAENSDDSYHSRGNYDATIVAIAIGDDPEMDIDTSGEDDGFDDIVTGITAAIDDTDIDHEETWLRKCTGDVPDGIDSNPETFGKLPPEVQMKLVLDLREREKATLLGNLRECSNVVERLKEQLYESEDKRMELEHELDTENTEVEEMKREFQEMKEAHKCRIRDIERITKEMLVQRERLSRIIEQQQRHTGSSIALPCPSDSESSKSVSGHSEENGDQPGTTTVTTATSGEKRSRETTTKSKMEIDFEHKLETSPQFREEFERFKEFQVYYQAVTRSHQHETNPKDLRTTLSYGEEYRKLLEFQLGYERMLSSSEKKST